MDLMITAALIELQPRGTLLVYKKRLAVRLFTTLKPIGVF